MNYTRILYFTRRLGKYKILIPCDGKKYFPSRPKVKKNTFPRGFAAWESIFFILGLSGKYFLPSRGMSILYLPARLVKYTIDHTRYDFFFKDKSSGLIDCTIVALLYYMPNCLPFVLILSWKNLCGGDLARK